MLTGVEVFGNHLAATAAHLGGVFGINAYHITTSAFRLVRSELHELIPSHIRDAPVDGGISLRLHPRNVQILKCDELIGIDQLTAFLMREIPPPVGLALVGMLQRMDDFLALRAAFRKRLFLALQAGDVFIIAIHPPLALDFVAIRKSGKRGQPQVNAHHLITRWERTCSDFAGKGGKPIPNAVSPDGQGLYFPFHWAMLYHL